MPLVQRFGHVSSDDKSLKDGYIKLVDDGELRVAI